MLGKGLESLIPPMGENKPENTENNIPAPVQEGFPQAVSREMPPPIAPSEPAVIPIQAAPQEAGAFPSPEKQTPPVFLRPEERKPLPAAPPQKPQKRPDEDHIFHIETLKIVPNPNQPRKNFNEDGIRELAYSIREFGFLQPLVVTRVEAETPAGVDVSYQLIAGERRLMAAKLLGLGVVPAIIRNVDLEREKLELAVIENIQRQNLDPIETARAFQRLQEEFRMTQREIASKLGKSRETVANSVRLLDLPPYVQDALGRGELTESHGRFLLAIEDPGAQKRLFDDIVNYKLTTRDVKERVQAAKGPRGAPPAAVLPPELKMIQERLSAELGTPVSIHKKGEEAGKIEISFYSKEELQNILNKLGTEA